MGSTQGMLCLCRGFEEVVSRGEKSIQIWCPDDMEGAKNHNNDCYFRCWDVRGYNSKNKKVIFYPNLPSDLRPVVLGPEVPALRPTEILEDASPNISDSAEDDEEF
jgi:hypothetical protein